MIKDCKTQAPIEVTPENATALLLTHAGRPLFDLWFFPVALAEDADLTMPIRTLPVEVEGLRLACEAVP